MESLTSTKDFVDSAAATIKNVRLSPWVNERSPPWADLLSARDVARLTRRPRWLLSALLLMRKLPQPVGYRGQKVGWLKADIVNWLAKDIEIACKRRRSQATDCHSTPLQRPLDLRCSPPCQTHRAHRLRR